MNQQDIYQMTRQLTDSVIPPPKYDVGSYVLINNEPCKIVSGAYWVKEVTGRYGFSNSWSWQRLLPSGKLSRTQQHGYGGKWVVLTRKEALAMARHGAESGAA